MTSSYRKLIWWRLFDCFRYGIQPAMRETHVFQLRRTRRIDRFAWILPTFAAMPQVQTTHARAMLCKINKAKYPRSETRSICINRLIVSSIMHEQTNSFLCTTNFCLWRAELRCEEVALSKTEIEDGCVGDTRRTRIRDSFGRYRLSDVPPSQRGDNSESSRGLAPTTRVHMILFYNNYDSFACYIESVYRQTLLETETYLWVYVFTQLTIQPITPKVNVCRSILVQARSDASFVRETGDGRLMRVSAYFATPPVVVNDAHDYNIDTLRANLEHKVEQWNKPGSNFNIDRVSRFVLSVHPYRRCTAPRTFPRQSSWRRNIVWSTSKTMTTNASFGACCRHYIQPLAIHIV